MGTKQDIICLTERSNRATLALSTLEANLEAKLYVHRNVIRDHSGRIAELETKISAIVEFLELVEEPAHKVPLKYKKKEPSDD